MLLKNYNPNKWYLNNDNIQTMDTTTLFDTFKNIKYPTTPLSIFDNIPTNTILSLFEEQYKLIEIEANTYLKYQFLSQSAYNSTLEQYNALFYYNEHFYKKSELKKYISDQHDSFATIISNPNPLPPQISIAQQTNSQKKQVIKINRKRIRNITWYSPDFIPKRSETWTPIYVERQDQLIRDTHDIILVIASRQCWKSYSLSEKAIEESFIHNNDILVWAFTNDTTKVIRNYILKFIRKFPETTFNHNKAERYIQNMETGSKIYMRSLADDAVDWVRWLTLNTIIVDEAQKVSEYAFNEVLEPTLATTGGKMILIWTPPKSLTWFFVESILKYKRWELPYASYYEIPLDKQPFTHPKVRNRVSEQKHLSHIRRERYCSLEASEDRLFNPKLATEYPQLNSNWYFVLGIDPARKHDRSWYCLSYTANWKANIILSWFVPDRFKWNNQTSQYWKLQAIFFERLIQPYRKFWKIITVMDSSWVWDWVVTIFNDAGFKIHNTIRYTSGATYTAKWLDYTVSKSVLINNTLNFIDEELLEIVDVTNKDLIEEMKYIYEAETKKRVITFESKFFDDITNAMMINLFIVKERRLINRDTTSNQHNQTIPTSWIKMVDAFDETYRKPLKANHLKSRNRSSTW